MTRYLESLASSIGSVKYFNVGQVSIALPSFHQFDYGIRDIGLSCCGGYTNAETVGIILPGVNM